MTTTILLDCGVGEDNPFCRPCWNANCPAVPQQNEVRTIVALAHSPNMPSLSVSRFSALKLDAPLTFSHYGGREYQAEVALLDRRIVLEGEDSGDRFGGHVQVMGPNAEGRFSGVRAEGMGQLNQLGRYESTSEGERSRAENPLLLWSSRVSLCSLSLCCVFSYPLHFHLMGTSAGASSSYIQDSSITNSHFRCAVIHGTNSTRLSRNTAFNVTGMSVHTHANTSSSDVVPC